MERRWKGQLHSCSNTKGQLHSGSNTHMLNRTTCRVKITLKSYGSVAYERLLQENSPLADQISDLVFSITYALTYATTLKPLGT